MQSKRYISDLARLTYIGKEKLLSLFRVKPTKPVDIIKAELEAMVTRLAHDHKTSEEAIKNLMTEASELLEELRVREEEEMKQWRANASEWLLKAGVDSKCVEEFLKNPTLANLEELRKKYPCS
jgi:hypothetical protein